MGNQRDRLRLMAALAAAAIAACVLVSSGAAGIAERTHSSKRTPVVVFPAFHFTKLTVTVRNQTAAPGCPASGSFEDWFLNDTTSPFSQVCQDRLLTLRYDARHHKRMPDRFSNQRGVKVAIKDYGKTESAPFYEDMYLALEGAGYVRDRDIRVAGYDSRLTPDMAGFLERTKWLIEDTYYDNGRRPVHLVGHSNGPLYAQYLLTHTSQRWKDKYVHGFTPIAGNFPGQGVLYPLLFTGLNITDFLFPATVENAVSSAEMYLTLPSTYMSAADPKVFGRHRDRGREPVQRQDVHAAHLPAASPRRGSRLDEADRRLLHRLRGLHATAPTSRTWTSTPRRAQASRRRSASVSTT